MSEDRLIKIGKLIEQLLDAPSSDDLVTLEIRHKQSGEELATSEDYYYYVGPHYAVELAYNERPRSCPRNIGKFLFEESEDLEVALEKVTKQLEAALNERNI